MSACGPRRARLHKTALATIGRDFLSESHGDGPPTSCEGVMKSQGEIEAAISDGIARFEQEYMGRGPKDIHAHLIGSLLVIRLHGVLTAAEQQLVKTLPPEKGRDL